MEKFLSYFFKLYLYMFAALNLQDDFVFVIILGARSVTAYIYDQSYRLTRMRYLPSLLLIMMTFLLLSSRGQTKFRLISMLCQGQGNDEIFKL